LYNTANIYGNSPEEQYGALKDMFDLYLKCGGYPGAVKAYVLHDAIEEINEALNHVYNVFVTESAPYFTNVEDRAFLASAILGIARLFIKEKAGMAAIKRLDADPNLLRDGFYNKSLGKVISWLVGAHIVGECGRALNCKFDEAADVARYFFRDVGFARLILSQYTVHVGDLVGGLAETFAFLALRKLLGNAVDLFPKKPVFGTYDKGEIDFLIKNLATESVISLEAKYSGGEAPASQKALKDGKINFIVKAQSKGPFGIEGKMHTIPIYLLGRFKFELGVRRTDAFWGKLAMPRPGLISDGSETDRTFKGLPT
jgi:predicted AAA+ superfamily ATPase